MSRIRKIILGIVIVIIIGFIALQLVPIASIYPPSAAPGNPPVTYNIKWDSAQTEQLARAACFDCHSNETRYPWYSSLAPVSWMVNEDINKGRQKMNFSTGRELEGDEMIEQIQREKMPMDVYLSMHSEANLTAAQKQQLMNGFQATFGG